jgi:hypothetical protein
MISILDWISKNPDAAFGVGFFIVVVLSIVATTIVEMRNKSK